MKTIALDFDGVIHSYESGWLGEGILEHPLEGAQDFIKDLQDRNFKVIIFSVRAATIKGQETIKQWLRQHGFSADIQITNAKPKASLYVDDRGLRFEGNFDEVLDYIDYTNPELKTWSAEK